MRINALAKLHMKLRRFFCCPPGGRDRTRFPRESTHLFRKRPSQVAIPSPNWPVATRLPVHSASKRVCPQESREANRAQENYSPSRLVVLEQGTGPPIRDHGFVDESGAHSEHSAERAGKTDSPGSPGVVVNQGPGTTSPGEGPNEVEWRERFRFQS